MFPRAVFIKYRRQSYMDVDVLKERAAQIFSVTQHSC